MKRSRRSCRVRTRTSRRRRSALSGGTATTSQRRPRSRPATATAQQQRVVSQPRRPRKPKVLQIIGYFATSELRKALDTYFQSRTVIGKSRFGNEDHFYNDRTPATFTGRRTRGTDNGQVEDSYSQQCQVVESTLPDFYDSFCMLYSMYNQARRTYFDATPDLMFNAPRCLPPLFTVPDEEWLFRIYKPHLESVVSLDARQKKELCRLLSNRDLLVRLFRIMDQDPRFWELMIPIWENQGWTERDLRPHFEAAISEFAQYTFEQTGVPRMTFIDLLADKRCTVTAEEKAASGPFTRII